MADKTTSDDELVIHFNLDGLVSLMRAVESAMATGHARLEPGSGVIAVSSAAASFAGATLTFSDCGGGGLALAA